MMIANFRPTTNILVLCATLIAFALPKPEMSHEEEVVRTTYAKLVFAVQVGEIERVLQDDPKGVDHAGFTKRIKQSELSFNLSDFRVGNITEINEVKLSDLVTKPSGEILATSAGETVHTENGANEITSAHANLSWSQGQELTEDWNVPFGSIASIISGQNHDALFTRYASYSVLVTFQGRSRNYRAMFLFGKEVNGEAAILAADNIVNHNGGALHYFIKHTAYPGILVETNKRTLPVISEWLKSIQALGAPGGTHDVACDPEQMKCGVAEEDIRRVNVPSPTSRKIGPTKPNFPHAPRLAEAVFHESPKLIALPAYWQSTDPCSPRNFNTGPIQSQTPFDTTLHLTGNHFLSDIKNKACTYTQGSNSNGACNVHCSTQVTGTPNESGLTISTCHQPVKLDKGGDADGIGTGASCTGASGMAVKACFFCFCNVDISLTILGTGVKISSTDAFFTVEDDTTLSCGQQNPVTATTAGGGGIGGGTCGNGVGNTGGATAFGDGSSSDSGTTCGPGAGSPIIIDTEGEGFHLTSASGGVLFDIRGDGHPVQIAWTAAGFHNAFLALPGQDGLVHNGKELFGNFTSQPPADNPNGFLALAQFDKPENGGNGDNFIDERDEVYSKLRLWIDENHDGVAQASELHTLPELGVYAISLDYYESRRRDDFGNQFRYKAKVNPSGWRRDARDVRSDVGRWTYDVFFTIAP